MTYSRATSIPSACSIWAFFSGRGDENLRARLTRMRCVVLIAYAYLSLMCSRRLDSEILKTRIRRNDVTLFFDDSSALVPPLCSCMVTKRRVIRYLMVDIKMFRNYLIVNIRVGYLCRWRNGTLLAVSTRMFIRDGEHHPARRVLIPENVSHRSIIYGYFISIHEYQCWR